MDGLGKHLLACSALSHDKDGGIGPGHPAGNGNGLGKFRVLADQIGKGEAGLGPHHPVDQPLHRLHFPAGEDDAEGFPLLGTDGPAGDGHPDPPPVDVHRQFPVVKAFPARLDHSKEGKGIPEDLLHRPADTVLGQEAEDAAGHPVHMGDQTIVVDGDEAVGNGLDHGIELVRGPLQAQLVFHRCRRRHNHAQGMGMGGGQGGGHSQDGEEFPFGAEDGGCTAGEGMVDFVVVLGPLHLEALLFPHHQGDGIGPLGFLPPVGSHLEIGGVNGKGARLPLDHHYIALGIGQKDQGIGNCVAADLLHKGLADSGNGLGLAAVFFQLLPHQPFYRGPLVRIEAPAAAAAPGSGDGSPYTPGDFFPGSKLLPGKSHGIPLHWLPTPPRTRITWPPGSGREDS